MNHEQCYVFDNESYKKLIQVYVSSLVFTAFIYITIHISYNGFSVDET